MKIKRGIRKKKKWPIIIGIVCSVVVLIVLLAFLYMNSMLNKIQYSAGITSTDSIALDEDDLTSSENSADSEVSDAEQSIQNNLENSSTELMNDNNVFSVLLIGCDSRSNTNSGRSDCMIILSINKNTGKIVMTSLMRDIYLSIPGKGYNRLNAAYSYGGSSLLLKTIESNYKISIGKYISVNFFSFIDIIDELGGVTISVSEAEVPVLNSYVREINSLEGLSKNDGILPEAGDNLTLTGKQALGYSRIRYVGNADYQRTERQRTVLTQVFDKLKDQDVVKLNDILNTLLPDVTTNLTKEELYSLILSAPIYSKYTLEEDRIPIDGSYKGLVINHMDVLSIDFEKNIQEMKTRIFG